MSAPKTRLSTRLSGSARETETRIRNIFQGQRRRPPALLMLALSLAILLCGSLVSCQPGQSTPTPDPAGTPTAPVTPPPSANVTAIVPSPDDDTLQTLLFQRTAQLQDPQSTAPAGGRLLLSYPAGNLTLGVLHYDSGVHAGGNGNLSIGVMDNTAGQLVDDPIYLHGDAGKDICAWVTDGRLYLLCTNTHTGMGWETMTGLGWFAFDADGLEQLTDLPDTARAAAEAAGIDTALLTHNPLSHEDDFWDNRKAVAVDTGLVLYRRAEGYDASAAFDAQWNWEAFLPFAGDAVSGPAFDHLVTLSIAPSTEGMVNYYADLPEGAAAAALVEAMTRADFPTRLTDLSNLRRELSFRDTVWLLAEDRDSDTALYGVAQLSAGGESFDAVYGLILRQGDTWNYHNLSWGANIQQGEAPGLWVGDFDGDGQQEAAVALLSGAGSSFSLSDLFLFEPDSPARTCLTFSYNDFLPFFQSSLNDAGSAVDLTFHGASRRPSAGWRIPLTPGQWENGFLGLSLGNFTSFTCEDGQLKAHFSLQCLNSPTAVSHFATLTADVVWDDYYYLASPVLS